MKRVSKLKTRIPKFFGVVFELFKRINCLRYQLLYKLHIRTRLGHDLAYKNFKWYKKASDSKVPANARKVGTSAFIISFVLFSLVQYLLPNLFNLGNPGKTFAARSYREWTYRGDFYNNTGKSSVKISGSIDDEDANVTLSDPDFNWGAVTNPTGAPLGGTGESIVWTGDTGNPATSNKAIIWGGFNGSNTNTGRIYNPTNNTWSPTSTGTNVATARNGHAAVWTGSTGNPATTNKMLISQAASDSRLYDPASNSWSTLPSLPSGILGRQNSSYAWTGNTGNSATANRFIFWGGANRSDGAVYNALDNTWATMATSPLVGRNSQLSACTGSKFIIFGGMSGGGVPLNDGAVYDLETNTWGPIFTTNLAQGPGLSVWTGDRMIFYTGSSGRLLSLNPTNLSVELLAPPPMSMGSNSVFAFKDGKIVYWGGAISGTYYNNGYLYDVTNNTWSTITQTNLGIEARGGAVYVWAGNMLIIFGGNGGTNLNNGQLLGSTYPLSGNVSNFRIDSGTLKKAKWNTISWNGTAPTSGSSTTAIKFRTRGTNSTNQTILDDPDTNMTGDPNTGWTYWNQDNTGSTFYTISNSSIVTPATRYLDVQLTLTSNDGALTPTLNDFRVDYDTLESPSSISVLRNDNGSAISAGGYTNETSVKVKATNLSCTDCAVGTSTERKIEVEAYTGAPTGTPTAPPGDFNDSTFDSTATLTNLVPGSAYKLKIRAIDKQGRQTDWVDYNGGNVAFTVDQVVPTLTNFQLNSGAQYVSSQIVTVSLTASDALSGVKEFRLKNESGSWSTPYSYPQTVNWSLSAGDGLKTVSLEVNDNAGNVTSNSAQIRVDTQKPTTPTTSTPNTWETNSKPTFTWSASSDPGSGLARYELKIGSWTKTITNATVGVTPANPLDQTVGNITYTLQNGEELTQGSKTWEIKSVDNIANSSDITSQTFGYDSDNSPGPVVSLAASPNLSDRVRLSWDKFADSGSPITKYKIERIQTDRITESDWSVGDQATTGYALFEMDNPVGPTAPVFWDFSTEAPLDQIPAYQTTQYATYAKLVAGVRYSYRVFAKDSAYDFYDINTVATTQGYTSDQRAPYSPSATAVTPCADGNCATTDADGNANVKGHSNKVEWTKSYDEGTGLAKYNIYRSVTNYVPNNLLNQNSDRGDWTLVGSLTIVSENLDPTIWYDNDATNIAAGTPKLNDYVRYYYRVTAVDKNNNESKLIPLFNTEYTVTANNNNPTLDPNTYNSAFGRTVDITAPLSPETFYVLRKGVDASNVTQKVEIRWSDANDFVGQEAGREPKTDSNGVALNGSGVKEYKLYYAKEDEDGDGNPLGTYGAWQEFVFNVNDPEYSKTNGLNSVIQAGLKDYWNYKFKIKVIDNATPAKETEHELAQPVRTFSSAIPSSPNLQVNSVKTGVNKGKEITISFPGSKSKAHNIVKYEVYRDTTYNGEDGVDWISPEKKVREFIPEVTHFDDSAQTYTFADTPIAEEAEGAKSYFYIVKVTDDTIAEEGGPFYNYSVIDTNSLHAGWDITPDIKTPLAPPLVNVKDTYPNNQYVRNIVTWQIPEMPVRRKLSYENCTVVKTEAGIPYCSDFAKYEVHQEKYLPNSETLVSDNPIYETTNYYDNIYTDNITYDLPPLNYQDYKYKYYVLVYDNAGTNFKYNDIAKTLINSSSNVSEKAYAPDPITPSQTTPALAEGTSVELLEVGVSSAVIHWHTNQEADSLVEYKIQGSSDPFIAVGDRNRQIEHTVKIFDLKTDTVYEYRVVSRNKLGNDMIITSVPVLKTDRFKIEIPEKQEDFLKITTTSIQFYWNTSKDAKTNFIEYFAANDPDNPQLRGIAGQLATSTGYNLTQHTVVLKGLRSNTEYRFKVKSVSTDNYQDEKPETQNEYFSFVTARFDTEQFTMTPNSSNLAEKNITSTSAQIVWETASPTSAKVFYGTENDINALNNSAGSGEYTTKHVVKIQGLVPGTKYYYYVLATDEYGNTYTSQIFTFTAVLKPKISDFKFTSVKPYQITISWTTNVDTETVVNFGKTTSYGEKRGKNELTKNHILEIDKLDDNSEYHMQIVAHDETGEEVVDEDKVIKTPLDTEGPKIESVKTDLLPMGSSDETASVIISWNTDKPATTMVEYDEGIISGKYTKNSVEDKSFNTSHTVIVKDLKPSSSYHYRIVSKDKRGNVSKSQDYTFVTPSKEKSILQLILKSLEETFAWTKNMNKFFSGVSKRIRGK